MEHVVSAGEKPSAEQRIVIPKLKESTMEGIDPSVLALLKDDDDKFIKWITFAAIFTGEGGLLNRGRRDEGGKDIGEIKAKLDCLQQEHQTAALNSLKDVVTAQHHSAEMSRQSDTLRLASDFAKCCCDLKAGQKDIVNEILRCCCDLKAGHQSIENTICTQNQLLINAGTANTQRLADLINKHANDETLSKLNTALTENSNLKQSILIKEEVAKCCSDNDHGRGRSG